MLADIAVIKVADGLVFAALCETAASYSAAVQGVWQQGEVLVNPQTGCAHKNPLVAVVEADRRDLLKLAAQFGLTPAAEVDSGAAGGNSTSMLMTRSLGEAPHDHDRQRAAAADQRRLAEYELAELNRDWAARTVALGAVQDSLGGALAGFETAATGYLNLLVAVAGEDGARCRMRRALTSVVGLSRRTAGNT